MVEQAPKSDDVETTIAVMDALERWAQDLSAEQEVSEVLGAVINDGGWMRLLRGWAELLAVVVKRDEETEEALFDFASEEPAFRRDLAARLVACDGQDRDSLIDVADRIIDLDDEGIWTFFVCLARAVRQHVMVPCGGVRHCLAVLSKCQDAADRMGRTESHAAALPCGVTLAAASVGNHEVARCSFAVGFIRVGSEGMLSLLWLVAQDVSRGRTTQAYVLDERGVPDHALGSDHAVGTDPSADPDQWVHLLTLRLLRTPSRALTPTSDVLAEIHALETNDKALLLWNMSTAVASLLSRFAPHQASLENP